MKTFTHLVIVSILRNTKWPLMQALMPNVSQVILSRNWKDKKRQRTSKVRLFHVKKWLLFKNSIVFFRIQWNGCPCRSIWWCRIHQWLDGSSPFCLLVERQILNVIQFLEHDGPTHANLKIMISIFLGCYFYHLQFYTPLAPQKWNEASSFQNTNYEVRKCIVIANQYCTR